MAYPHLWSPISCRSSAGQGKFAGHRPTFYHCATPPTGNGEKREEGVRGGKALGGKGKGAATGILREGRHVAKYGTAGEYRLG